MMGRIDLGTSTRSVVSMMSQGDYNYRLVEVQGRNGVYYEVEKFPSTMSIESLKTIISGVKPVDVYSVQSAYPSRQHKDFRVMVCSCKGFFWNRYCKHVDWVENIDAMSAEKS